MANPTKLTIDELKMGIRNTKKALRRAEELFKEASLSENISLGRSNLLGELGRQGAETVVRAPVTVVVTPYLVRFSSEDQLVDIMEVMTLQRIRHLPVIQNGALHGIVSIATL